MKTTKAEHVMAQLNPRDDLGIEWGYQLFFQPQDEDGEVHIIFVGEREMDEALKEAKRARDKLKY